MKRLNNVLFLLAFSPLLMGISTIAKKDNSALASLTEGEKDYYDQVFDYVMEVTKPGESYSWKTYSSNGTLKVGPKIKAKGGESCRQFSEEFSVNNAQGKGTGYGCKREGRAGWCKLETGNALTCAMEPLPTHQKVLRDASETLDSAKKYWWWPF